MNGNLVLDKTKKKHCSYSVVQTGALNSLLRVQLQGSDGELEEGGAEGERDIEEQMNAEAVKHLDTQISCYARDPPQGTSG